MFRKRHGRSPEPYPCESIHDLMLLIVMMTTVLLKVVIIFLSFLHGPGAGPTSWQGPVQGCLRWLAAAAALGAFYPAGRRDSAWSRSLVFLAHFFWGHRLLWLQYCALYFRVSHSSYKTAPESDSSKIAWNSLLLSTASDAENCKVSACSLPWTRATWGVPSCLKGLRRYLGPSPSWCQISCSSWKTCSLAGQKLLVYMSSVISDGMLGVHKPTLSQTWASGSQHINIQELLAKQMHTLWLSMFWLECGKWSRALLVSQKSRGSERKHEMSPKCCWQHAMMLMPMLKMNKIEEDGDYLWSWLAAI